MRDWDRTLQEALAQTPPWPGSVEALWHRVARRIRRPRARRPWQPVAAVAAAAAALALVWRAAVPAAPRGAPDVAISTQLITPPAAGGPLQFVVDVTGTGDPVHVQEGHLEVRAAGGDRVWQAPLPELRGREVGARSGVRAHITWPGAPAPGHYRAGVNLVAASPAGNVQDLSGGAVEFFVPFPRGAVREGTVPVGRTLTRGPVAATLDQVTLSPDATRLHFTLLGERLAGFHWRILDAAGNPLPHVQTEYRREGARLTGVAAFEPTLASVPRLLVRLEKVGFQDQGARVVELPYLWEWQVHLGP